MGKENNQYNKSTKEELFGFYKKNNIFYDVKLNDNYLQYFQTKIHEQIHYVLTGRTILGGLQTIIENILEFENINDFLSKNQTSYLKDLLSRIRSESIEVQESIASFMQLIILKERNKELFYAELEKYKKNDIYWNGYKLSRLSNYFEYGIEVASLIFVAGIFAMNIDYISLGTIDKHSAKKIKKLKKQFSPNTRFKYFLRKFNVEECKSEDDVINIYSNIGITIKPSDSFFFEWLEKYVINSLDLPNISNFVTYKTSFDFPYSQPFCFNDGFIKIQLIENNNFNLDMFNLTVMESNDNKVYECLIVDTYFGKMYKYETTDVKKILGDNRVLLTNLYCFKRIQNMILPSKNVFVFLGGLTDRCFEFLRTQSKKKYYFYHSFSETSGILFFSGSTDNIIFCQTVSYEDLGLILKNLRDFTQSVENIDEIFYTKEHDYWTFEIIIRFIVQEALFSENEKSYIGRRMIL